MTDFKKLNTAQSNKGQPNSLHNQKYLLDNAIVNFLDSNKNNLTIDNVYNFVNSRFEYKESTTNVYTITIFKMKNFTLKEKFNVPVTEEIIKNKAYERNIPIFNETEIYVTFASKLIKTINDNTLPIFKTIMNKLPKNIKQNKQYGFYHLACWMPYVNNDTYFDEVIDIIVDKNCNPFTLNYKNETAFGALKMNKDLSWNNIRARYFKIVESLSDTQIQTIVTSTINKMQEINSIVNTEVSIRLSFCLLLNPAITIKTILLNLCNRKMVTQLGEINKFIKNVITMLFDIFKMSDTHFKSICKIICSNTEQDKDLDWFFLNYSKKSKTKKHLSQICLGIVNEMLEEFPNNANLEWDLEGYCSVIGELSKNYDDPKKIIDDVVVQIFSQESRFKNFNTNKLIKFTLRCISQSRIITPTLKSILESTILKETDIDGYYKYNIEHLLITIK